MPGVRRRRLFYAAWCALSFSWVGCGDNRPANVKETSLPALVDQNSDPHIVEVTLVATLSSTEYIEGKRVEIYAYRDGAVSGSVGTVPGPVLDAKRGDRVIVHYRNELPVETTVHWHGLRLPNASDGTPSSQVPVLPGESFIYDFIAMDAGTFWYHPHMAADVLIERGLYGVMRVTGDIEPAAAADRIFVLDDVKLTGDGQLSDEATPLDVMLGKQGNFLLVNGRQHGRISVEAGSKERWRFVNTANGRYFNLRLTNRRFFVIAWDAGLLPNPYWTDTLLIAPGERYEVLVLFNVADANARLTLETVHYDRGHDIPDPGPQELMQVSVVPGSRLIRDPELPFAWGEWSALPVTGTSPVRKFELREEEGAAFPKFFINDEQFPHHTPIHGSENDVEIWEIHNETEMDHPFHLHGMFFQVLDVNGTAPTQRGQKDTVNVPRESKLRFAVRYASPGNWMYHCHILEHAERGMMGELRIAAPGVVPPSEPRTPPHPSGE